jgi:KaiC/GvpD/RAD55 family RecA-like ATPase
MSLAQRLPEELREFLSLPGPQSLLVRGPPGSGKTTLCLAMLEAAPGHKILLTSRVSQAELNRGFPWLGENGGARIQVVDTSNMDATIVDVGRSLASARHVVDERGAQGRELEEFLWLPTAVQEAWSRLPPDSPSIIIIDSWDALVEQYLGGVGGKGPDLPDRHEVERILLRQLGRGRAHVIIVLERREESQLDYLVNGVLVTQREMVNDRLERWLHLPKLRGIRIANAYYPYTVEAARFQCIEPIKAYTQMRRGPFEPEPDAMPGHIWPGCGVFAENFGRLPIGKTTLIETDGDVQEHVLQLLLSPMIASVVSAGGRALLVPSPSLSAKEIWDSVHPGPPRHKLETGFRVGDVTGQLVGAARQLAPEFARMVLPLGGMVAPPDNATDSSVQSESALGKFLGSGASTGAPVLSVAYVGGFLSMASALGNPMTPDAIDNFPGMVQTGLGSAPMHLVVVGRTGIPIFESLRSLAALHIHLRGRQGRVFVYGSKPWTSGLVLTEGNDSIPYDLLRIV